MTLSASDSLRAADPAAILNMTADVMLIMETDGTIVDAKSRLETSEHLAADWVGRSFRDIVTIESQEKVDALLDDLKAGAPRWRQVNHPREAAALDHPVRYCTLPLKNSKRVLGLGQDLLPRAELQQQLVDAQQNAEQDYWRLQQAEARFQVMFDSAPEPVFITNADGGRLIEANPTATTLLKAANQGGQRSLGSLFHSSEATRLKDLFARARTTGYSEETGVRLTDDTLASQLSCSLHRHGDASVLITKLYFGDHLPPASESAATALRLLENLPEAAVLLDERQNILWANEAFAQLAQFANVEQLINTEMSTWMGRSAVDLNVLAANVRKSGTVSAFQTTIHGQLGLRTPIEATAAAFGTTDADGTATTQGMGLILRARRQRPAQTAAPEAESRDDSKDQISELVGRMPLKELVRESSEEIERLAIDASLKLTENNRAAAAEMLGISRQSLYFKLRRYGYLDSDD